jgi:hypothetical protein
LAFSSTQVAAADEAGIDLRAAGRRERDHRRSLTENLRASER